MRVSINLATKPFIELRPLLLKLRYAIGGLVLLALGLGIWLQALQRSAAAAEAQLADVRARTSALVAERQRNEGRMRQPGNRAVLDRSHFLNAVFTQKSFSWTAVMMDLERVLPSGVQVTSIEPQVASDGTVTIRLRVSGERDRTVELVRNLERSSRFVAPRLANESAQATEGSARNVALQTAGGAPGAVEFDILSGYNPLPESRGPRAATVTHAGDGTPAGTGVRAGAQRSSRKGPGR